MAIEVSNFADAVVYEALINLPVSSHYLDCLFRARLSSTSRYVLVSAKGHNRGTLSSAFITKILLLERVQVSAFLQGQQFDCYFLRACIFLVG